MSKGFERLGGNRLIKLKLRKIAAAIVYYSGLIHVIGKRRNLSVILTYHRIYDREKDSRCGYVPGISVKPETFEKHLKYVARHFRTISLKELGERIQIGEEIKNYCVITLDDGWGDNYYNAFPIIRRHSLLATIFLTTDFVGSDKQPWFAQIANLLCKSRLSENYMEDDIHRFQYLEEMHLFEILSNNGYSEEEKIDKILMRMKGLSQSDITRATDEISIYLRTSAMIEPSERLFLMWEQIVEMGKDGIEFGSHTASHLILTNAGEDIAKEELGESKKTIEERIGKDVGLLCYPNGDFSERIRDIVRNAGYCVATTTRKGFISHRSDPLLLERIMVHEDIASTTALFACRIEGVPFF